jgi:membrane protein
MPGLKLEFGTNVCNCTVPVQTTQRDCVTDNADSASFNPVTRWAWLGSVIADTARGLVSDRVSLAAAGCAFYATLALFPAIATLVFVYGLAFDPLTVEPQLQVLREFLPAAAFQLISERVHMLVIHPRGALGLGLIVSTSIAFWSAATGTKSIFSALNVAYDVPERRGILQFQATALTMTFCAILGAVLALSTMVFLPVAIGFLGLADHQATLINLAGLVVMMLFVLVTLRLLYRFGPCHFDENGREIRHRIGPGALVATLVWLLASLALSFYVSHLASYDATYGPLGAVVGLMMWFYATAYAVLLGAELNAVLERAAPDRQVPQNV